MTFSSWLESARTPSALLVVKRLSANDTGATGTHQVGTYLPRWVIDELLPELVDREKERNPKVVFQADYASHDAPPTDVTCTWYNNRLFGGTRNEFRLTGWGGRLSPLQDTELTGGVCVMAFSKPQDSDLSCVVWVCSDEEQEAEAEAALGAIEPGEIQVLREGRVIRSEKKKTDPCDREIPASWLTVFPPAQALVSEAIRRCRASSKVVDDLLVARRDCEFRLFSAVEKLDVLPRVTKGFPSVEAFIALAGQITNRRKSRSGRSLELHLVELFKTGNLAYEHSPVSEGVKRPDFLFPSAAAYHDQDRRIEDLRMLGVKTTCKDRWRQVVNEAHRLERKHLLTLQEGVSVNQFDEMTAAGLTLVVPRSLHTHFPKLVRPKLLSLKEFMDEVRRLPPG